MSDMSVLKYSILLLPFIIELFGDYWLIKKGKRDLSAISRVVLISIACWVVSYGFPGSPIIPIKYLIIAVLPYSVFDPCLNLLRGKKLLYSGKTKGYDLFLAMFPPWVVLVGRLVFVVVLLVIYNLL
jgi:hypothetical protein